jgi:hypothetical protein
LRWIFLQAGPFAILALALLERIKGQGILGYYLDPIIRAIFIFVAS